MPSPAEMSKAERLAMYARPLQPARPPFYVQHVTAECPLMGWWWQPTDDAAPQPLAAQYDLAVARIAALVETRRGAAA